MWLSHDMEGYEGVESLAYRALARVCIPYSECYMCLIFFQVLEQVEGGDLVVNRGDESRPKESASDRRDLNVVDGYEAALMVSQVLLIFLGCRKFSNP